MMNAPTRNFEAKTAVRESVPLLVGLMGPSGSGKTFSALRLATGIQAVTGGDVYVIDTEARRALHYADNFKFKHIQFDAPFGSLDYLAAMEHCVKQGAKVIVVDSMTHEHTGPGGYLMTQEAEVERMAGNDYAKRERVKMAGWIKPAALRGRMISGILQLNANMVFCFRAKEKTKPKQGGGIVELGFMPVAGEELLFEMTVNCLLLPKSGGVPSWQSDQVGERQMMKLPEQFKTLFAEHKALDENTGRALATWAKGGQPSPHVPPSPTHAADSPGPAVHPESYSQPTGSGEITWAEYSERWDAMLQDGSPAQIGETWNCDAHKTMRRKIAPTKEQLGELMSKVQKATKP
jgi:ABC-type dipeptide/oligopeptide/nickel transport system ATPase subunit